MLSVTLIPILFGNQTPLEVSAPAGLIYFVVADSSSPLQVDDLAKLKESWRSKNYVKLGSGNYGVFRNGCYYLISKDVPLLKEARDRFELASKIITLSKDGRTKICQSSIKGAEFTDNEFATLGRQIDRWTGLRFSREELMSQGSFKFVFNSGSTLSSGGESYTVYPKYQYPSEEVYEFVRSNVVKSGMLTELSEARRKESFERNKNSSLIGVEAPDGKVTVRVFNASSEKPDISGGQKQAIEELEKISKDEIRRYREMIGANSAQIRKFQEYMFPDFESNSLLETDDARTRQDIFRQMAALGYSSKDAESRIGGLKNSGKDIFITMQTRIKSFGFDVSKFSITVRIWP